MYIYIYIYIERERERYIYIYIYIYIASGGRRTPEIRLDNSKNLPGKRVPSASISLIYLSIYLSIYN